MNRAACLIAVVGFSCAAIAQVKDSETAPAAAPSEKVAAPKTPAKAAAKEDASLSAVSEAVASSFRYILDRQESEGKEPSAQWPYEGVYRVKGEIPIGYRVGGTAICAMALLANPAYTDDADASAALARSRDFIISSIDHPLMSPDYDISYDVRGWGYTYALQFLLKLKDAGAIEDEHAAKVETAINFFVDAIEATEIPQVGGWNYSRPGGKTKPSPPSPFMTSPTLLALYDAAAHGYEVDPAVVDRALSYLESSKSASGAVVYAGAGERRRDGVPGATGRMLSSEIALYLAGRGSQKDLRAAVDAFIVHWDWLDQRRAKKGTHEGPYGVAPYYFYFAHYHAAQAVELLPAHERAEYRRRINALLFSVRTDDGGWNDRVFPRSASYGTAMASLALMMPELPKPAGWPATKVSGGGDASP